MADKKDKNGQKNAGQDKEKTGELVTEGAGDTADTAKENEKNEQEKKTALESKKAKPAPSAKKESLNGTDYVLRVCVGCRSRDFGPTLEKAKGWEKRKCRNCGKVQKFPVTE